MKRLALADVQASAAFKSALHVFIEGLSIHQRNIEKVVLFGSVARGEGGPESDVDLLVVWRGSLADARERLAQLTVDVLLQHGVHVSAHPVTPESFASLALMRTAFFEAVDREGLIVA